jgi:hypothetical protein
MPSRYKFAEPIPAVRLNKLVHMNNLTSQMPVIELIKYKRVRIWTAYDREMVCGTYTEVDTSGQVITRTVYPSGLVETKINRPRGVVRNGRKAERRVSQVRKQAV